MELARAVGAVRSREIKGGRRIGWAPWWIGNVEKKRRK